MLFAVANFLRFHPQIAPETVIEGPLYLIHILRVDQEDQTDFKGLGFYPFETQGLMPHPPYLLGEGQAMQYSVWPKSDRKTPVPRLPLRPPDDYLRQAMVAALDRGDVELDVRVQLQTDPHLMPIENAAVLWPERLSPRVSVATLRIPQQKFDSPAQIAFARRLSYNPWHCIAEHRPLGNQSRARRRMYYELSKYRHDMNGVPHYEPTGDETFD